MRNKRRHSGSDEDDWFDIDEAILEIRDTSRNILEALNVLLHNQGVINRNINRSEDFAMSRYTDMLANVQRLGSRVAGLKAVIQALADTPNEAQWKELNDAIIAHADEVQAAIDMGTPAAPPAEPLPSGGGAGVNE